MELIIRAEEMPGGIMQMSQRLRALVRDALNLAPVIRGPVDEQHSAETCRNIFPHLPSPHNFCAVARIFKKWSNCKKMGCVPTAFVLSRHLHSNVVIDF